MELVEDDSLDSPSALHKRKRHTGQAHVPTVAVEDAVSYGAALSQVNSLVSSRYADGASDDGERTGPWVDAMGNVGRQNAMRTVSLDETGLCAAEASCPSDRIPVMVHEDQGDHTDESASDSSHVGEEGVGPDMRPQLTLPLPGPGKGLEMLRVGPVGRVQGGVIGYRPTSTGQGVANGVGVGIGNGMGQHGRAALVASSGPPQPSAELKELCTVVWLKEREMEHRMVTFMTEAERRLQVHAVRMQRLSKAWQRYGQDIRAGSLSRSREALFLQDQVKAQAETIKRLMWQLAAKDAEANYLRASLASAREEAAHAPPPQSEGMEPMVGVGAQGSAGPPMSS